MISQSIYIYYSYRLNFEIPCYQNFGLTFNELLAYAMKYQSRRVGIATQCTENFKICALCTNVSSLNDHKYIQIHTGGDSSSVTTIVNSYEVGG